MKDITLPNISKNLNLNSINITPENTNPGGPDTIWINGTTEPPTPMFGQYPFSIVTTIPTIPNSLVVFSDTEGGIQDPTTTATSTQPLLINITINSAVDQILSSFYGFSDQLCYLDLFNFNTSQVGINFSDIIRIITTTSGNNGVPSNSLLISSPINPLISYFNEESGFFSPMIGTTAIYISPSATPLITSNSVLWNNIANTSNPLYFNDNAIAYVSNLSGFITASNVTPFSLTMFTDSKGDIGDASGIVTCNAVIAEVTTPELTLEASSGPSNNTTVWYDSSTSPSAPSWGISGPLALLSQIPIKYVITAANNGVGGGILPSPPSGITWYFNFTVMGGGGGGGGGYVYSGLDHPSAGGGGGGGSGFITKGSGQYDGTSTIQYSLGAGGAGGGQPSDGSNGSNSYLIINNVQYNAAGGFGGQMPQSNGVYVYLMGGGGGLGAYCGGGGGGGMAIINSPGSGGGASPFYGELAQVGGPGAGQSYYPSTVPGMAGTGGSYSAAIIYYASNGGYGAGPNGQPGGPEYFTQTGANGYQNCPGSSGGGGGYSGLGGNGGRGSAWDTNNVSENGTMGFLKLKFYTL